MKKKKRSNLDKHENKYWHIPKEVINPIIATIIFVTLAISLYILSTQVTGDVEGFALVLSIIFTITSLISFFISCMGWSLANDKIKLLKQGKKEVWVKEYYKKKTITEVKKIYVPGHFKVVKIKK